MREIHGEKGTIAIAFVDEALACLRRRGIDERPILQAAGISPELLAWPQARVSSAHYGTLWHGIAQVIDDEFFELDSPDAPRQLHSDVPHLIMPRRWAGLAPRAFQPDSRLEAELRVDGEQALDRLA
jgi:hypothetical protein